MVDVTNKGKSTFHCHTVRVYGFPLGVLSYALVIPAVTFCDITEAQAAAKHFFLGTGLQQLTVLLYPRNLRSWAEDEKSGDWKKTDMQQREGKEPGRVKEGRKKEVAGEKCEAVKIGFESAALFI